MIQRVTVGMLQEHTYFFIDEKTKHGFVIDPGAEGKRLLDYIKEKGWVIEKILLTHGHFDHMGAADFLKQELHCPIVCHEEGKAYLSDPAWNMSGALGEHFICEADSYVKHGDFIRLEANDKMTLRVIHAPGHTLDGIAFYCEEEGVAFVGDILFAGAIGRSDLPGGNMQRLMSAIRAQLFTLPENTVVYPGHGDTTTIGKEKETNPFFNFD
ncbi:MBL fold metallo-hydrolase [Sporanaerobium hydrogeniformans]|uniref:MBL fold metallo-hydrolase n=1 Tax=Sporanaerobium hydrogeniformans TaxID=3072179 RepID=A0AC61DFF2_9FIRM|nr:MBL fold metallo-hydrolase [Sporanaerobium hydrogeniformans]PHV71652.1 MBL fold metallo-hydrolase [Sporanaerobium hydrogeniformans]